jgi:transcription initiation factor TFIID subunit 6
LEEVRIAPGIHQLAPYFTQWISDQTVRSLSNLPMLSNVMRFAETLLNSEHINIEPYVTSLTLALNVRLTETPSCIN